MYKKSVVLSARNYRYHSKRLPGIRIQVIKETAVLKFIKTFIKSYKIFLVNGKIKVRKKNSTKGNFLSEERVVSQVRHKISQFIGVTGQT